MPLRLFFRFSIRPTQYQETHSTLNEKKKGMALLYDQSGQVIAIVYFPVHFLALFALFVVTITQPVFSCMCLLFLPRIVTMILSGSFLLFLYRCLSLIFHRFSLALSIAYSSSPGCFFSFSFSCFLVERHKLITKMLSLFFGCLQKFCWFF